MKCISWNVNGIRACVNKGFLDYFKEADADIFCIQESKMQAGQLELDLPGYHQYWNYAERKGYSGTALFTKQEPISVVNGIGIAEHDTEGRVITAEFDSYYFVTVYTPNSQNELKRLDYRMEWEDAFREYLLNLEKTKPVIVTGDMNVAHQEIDLKNPKANHKNAGFTDEERGKMTELLNAGFIDTFRYFYPDQEEIYSWWSYRFQARTRNAGWRIDYFLVSGSLQDKLVDAKIHTEIMGSDHCPVELEIAVEEGNMKIEKLCEGQTTIALVTGNEKVITDVDSALDLLMSVKHETGMGYLVIDKNLVTEDFFVLSTGLAGEILQKYMNYGGKIAVYGDYSGYTSKPLQDFIYESNQGKDFFFVASQEEAINKLRSVYA